MANRREFLLAAATAPVTSMTSGDLNLFAKKVPMLTGGLFIDGRKFDPQADMTPIECAWLSTMYFILAMTQQTWAPRDAAGFIKEHGLDRHFPEVEKGESK